MTWEVNGSYDRQKRLPRLRLNPLQLDSIVIPLCWIRSLPLLTSSAQAGARGAYNGSRSRYRCDGEWKGMQAHG